MTLNVDLYVGEEGGLTHGFYLVKIYLSMRKFLETVKKSTASQNVERRHMSSIIVRPKLNVGHGQKINVFVNWLPSLFRRGREASLTIVQSPKFNFLYRAVVLSSH